MENEAPSPSDLRSLPPLNFGLGSTTWGVVGNVDLSAVKFRGGDETYNILKDWVESVFTVSNRNALVLVEAVVRSLPVDKDFAQALMGSAVAGLMSTLQELNAIVSRLRKGEPPIPKVAVAREANGPVAPVRPGLIFPK